MNQDVWLQKLHTTAPKIHCLTNPVSMQDVANVLLAAGGSVIMAQEEAEVEEITQFCQATLLNTGVPDEKKFRACMLAGVRANELQHPVVIDPVGVGASMFRQRSMENLLEKVHPDLIRCNQEEACTLLHLHRGVSGGVESSVVMDAEGQLQLAGKLAKAYGCTAFVSGEADAVSDGDHSVLLTGGDSRISRITGSGCMLSALCALFCGTGLESYESALAAGVFWKESSHLAGVRTDTSGGGIGTFHMALFDVLDGICHGDKEEQIQ